MTRRKIIGLRFRLAHGEVPLYALSFEFKQSTLIILRSRWVWEYVARGRGRAKVRARAPGSSVPRDVVGVLM